jgi:hypothetical protein
LDEKDNDEEEESAYFNEREECGQTPTIRWDERAEKKGQTERVDELRREDLWLETTTKQQQVSMILIAALV